jgi:crossover junction endodeoxyribonuclease RuvC
MITTKIKYRLLGIDPGTNHLGYAVIEVEGQKLTLIEMGALSLIHLDEQPQKLKRIFERITEIINNHNPTSMAIEAPFFGKNVQSMLKLGRAQGVAITAGMMKNLEVTEYAPRKVKQSVTGKGASSKEQVAAMLEYILKIKLDDYTLDATDALGVAVCHHFQSGSPLAGQKKYSDWGAFAKDNEKKVKSS